MAGSQCGQFGGDTYCAPVCGASGACAVDRVCLTLNTAEGQEASLCVPVVGVCSEGSSTVSSSASTTTATTSTGAGETCGALLGPDLTACCTACQTAGQPCQSNGCYGGYYCNTDTCHCQPAPDPSTCTTSASATTTTTTTTSTTSTGSGGGTVGTVGVSGGTLDTLSFAIVGDTRPANEGDIGGYPTSVITRVWQDVQAQSPRPAFAVTTGDYQFSDPHGHDASTELGIYLQARASYGNVVFPAMGNHECTGATDSNCGSGNADGITNNYTAFLQSLLAPINQSNPYYEIDVDSTTGAWTSKFVFVAANAWSGAQSSWLDTALARPTTYTFVVRHESNLANTAPGVTPSSAIIGGHPCTLLIVGHTHTYEHISSDREVIVGNGGAPLSGSVNYGYVVARQRASDGAITLQSFDYSTNAVVDTFSVKADGSATH
jgi:hypothetical protein